MEPSLEPAPFESLSDVKSAIDSCVQQHHWAGAVARLPKPLRDAEPTSELGAVQTLWPSGVSSTN